MLIKIDTKIFSKALDLAQSIVDKKFIQQILGNILINAEDDFIQLITTDGDICVIQKIGAMIQSKRKVTVDCRILKDIVKKIDDEVTSISSGDDNTLNIIGEKFSFKLPTLPASDFPIMSFDLKTTECEMKSDVLYQMISNTEISICHQQSLYYLNGIYMKFEGDGSVYTASTDGHRLTLCQRDVDINSTWDMIIPSKTIDELKKVLKLNQSPIIKISANEYKVMFCYDNIVIISKLVDGKFPNCKNLVPTYNENVLIINRKALLNTIQRVSILSDEKYRAIHVKFNDKIIEVKSMGDPLKIAKEEIHIEDSYIGDEISISLNSDYLKKTLDTIEAEDVEIKLKNSNEPILINPRGDEKTSFVILPMKV